MPDHTAATGAAGAPRYRLAGLGGILEAVPDGVLVVDASGSIVLANARVEALFGYTRRELLGLNVELLVPDGLRARHAGLRDGYFAHPVARPLHSGLTLRGRRKDGADFAAEISLHSLDTDEGRFVSAAVRDVSGRTDLAVLRKSDEQLAQLQRRHDSILDAVAEGVQVIDRQGRIGFVNPAAARLLGWEAGELLGRPSHETIHHTRADGRPCLRQDCAIAATFRDAVSREVRDEVFWRRDGTSFPVEYATTPLRDPVGVISDVVLTFRDVTERRKLQQQLVQSQKMEAVGQLAGGVAHDFNNLLNVILGYAELLARRLPAEPRLARYLADIRRAGEQAAGLTQQLLAFSRRQVVQPKVMDLNDVVRSAEVLLRRLIGEDVQLVTVLRDDLGLVKADPGQVEQVIMNLAVNARDAMPRGGRLIIETANVDLDAAYARFRPDAVTGPHVLLAVSDNGQGMTPDVQAQIFEPFFTTKEAGKGTGLGLATVYGIIRQSGGHITVYSELGQGSTFKAYLPRVDQPRASEPHRLGESALPTGAETVLLVEDEPMVRSLTRDFLESLGYDVIAAADAAEALQLAGKDPASIRLLLTDVVMPGMGGRELADTLRSRLPDVRVVYMSGYTDDAVVRHGIVSGGVPFLQKPFSLADLARCLRQVLDHPPAPQG